MQHPIHNVINYIIRVMVFLFSVKEFMEFTSKIIVERTTIAQRASVKEQGEILLMLFLPITILQFN